MATEITMPQMGFDMTEGIVANWLKNVGDPVSKGDALAEVETDKTTIQIEAFASGVLLQVLVPAGQKVPVNTVIGLIGAAGESAPAAPAAAPAAVAAPAPTPVPAPVTSPAKIEGAFEISMPQMGFDMTEGTVANWLKKVGDPVAKGDALAEVETDKTTIQIEAFAAGTLVQILVPAGQKVPVNTVIGLIGDPSMLSAASAPRAPQTPAAAPANHSVEPQPISAGAAPASNAGVDATPVARRMADEFKIDLGRVKGTGPDGRITKADVEVFLADRQGTPAQAGGRVAASPYARKLAADLGLDLATVRGSGPAGRIVAEDVRNAPKPSVAKAVTAPAQPAAPVVAAVPAVASPAAVAVTAPVAATTAASTPGVTRKPLTRIRQTIARRMAEAKAQVPHYYVTMQVEMDAALTLRAQINESLKPEGIKVSVNDMVVKASAIALKRFPSFNATFAGDAIELREQINIGIAVAMDGGLLVVTLRDADKKTLKQIGAEVPAIANRVREGKAQPGDMGGQTFTTSNLGMYGVEMVVPIINQPDSAILGIGGAAPTAVVRDGQIVARTMMTLCLAGDHRVSDGAEGAQFAAEIKRILENPWAMVL